MYLVRDKIYTQAVKHMSQQTCHKPYIQQQNKIIFMLQKLNLFIHLGADSRQHSKKMIVSRQCNSILLVRLIS